jgi:hypothetical protein
MRNLKWIPILGMLIGVAAVNAQVTANTGFEKMKSLAGSWVGTTTQGKSDATSIRVVSNGTAIEEIMNSPGETQMVSMYTADGPRVSLMHYCSMGNQPHLETGSITANDTHYSFVYKGAENLASPSASHISHLNLQFIDNDHFTETWTFTDSGKDTVETIQLTRQK